MLVIQLLLNWLGTLVCKCMNSNPNVAPTHPHMRERMNNFNQSHVKDIVLFLLFPFVGLYTHCHKVKTLADAQEVELQLDIANHSEYGGRLVTVSRVGVMYNVFGR